MRDLPIFNPTGISKGGVPVYEHHSSYDGHFVWRAEAHRRAYWLLDERLSPAQRDTFWEHGYFDMEGSDGRTYRLCDWLRIEGMSTYNVGLWTDNRWRFFSVYPKAVDYRAVNVNGSYNAFPVGDRLLAQKIWLEINASHTVRTACSVVTKDYLGAEGRAFPEHPPTGQVSRYLQLRERFLAWELKAGREQRRFGRFG